MPAKKLRERAKTVKIKLLWRIMLTMNVTTIDTVSNPGAPRVLCRHGQEPVPGILRRTNNFIH